MYVSESWCGDYCVLLSVSLFITIISVITLLSVYLVKSRRAAGESREGILAVCCLTTRGRYKPRSGISTEYAFATTTSAAPTVQYRNVMMSSDVTSSAPPGDWYQQQLIALLQVHATHF